MYCRGCNYDLRHLNDARQCPECGRPFDPSDPTTFLATPPDPSERRSRPWVRICILLLIGIAAALLIQFYAAANQSGH